MEIQILSLFQLAKIIEKCCLSSPRACYDESKRVGETLSDIYFNYEGLITNTIRPFNVYGYGMQENDYRVLPNFARNIKRIIL